MNVKDHYAAAVLNDDMRPRLFKDESVIFAKDQMPRPDSDVFVSLYTGDYLIRELVSMDESIIQVRTYTPDATASIPLSEVAGVFPIVQRCFCSLKDLLGQLELPEDCHV